MSTVKKVCICAFCTALCYVLPLVFHALTIGTVFSPMHLPVLLCGLVCGWPYGAVCGVVGPLLSSLLTSMPPAAGLVGMVPELCAYGLFSGLLLKFTRTGRTFADLYLALVPAMLLGRVAGGVAKAVTFRAQAKGYSIAAWGSSYLVGTLAAIVMQLIVLPALVVLLMRAGAIPPRYPKTAAAK